MSSSSTNNGLTASATPNSTPASTHLRRVSASRNPAPSASSRVLFRLPRTSVSVRDSVRAKPSTTTAVSGPNSRPPMSLTLIATPASAASTERVSR